LNCLHTTERDFSRGNWHEVREKTQGGKKRAKETSWYSDPRLDSCHHL